MNKNIIKYLSTILSLVLIVVTFSSSIAIASAYTKAIRVKNDKDAAEYSKAYSYKPVALQSTKRKQSKFDFSKYILASSGGVKISTRKGAVTRLENNTYNAWSAMRTAAYYDGIDIDISFAYRSVADQQRLYDDYISGRSKIPAAKPPGAHQTGRAIDIFLGIEKIEDLSPEEQQALPAYQWLDDNAYLFGFYGWADKTDPEFEGWHWVYNP